MSDYFSKANVKVEFYRTNGTNTPDVKLYGFLTDEGLSLNLVNDFANTLEFAGSIFSQLRELAVGINTLVPDAAQKVQNAVNAISIKFGGKGDIQFSSELTTTANGYISLTGNGGNLILNAPYYWQGTKPIEFSLSLYQIADNERDVIQNYQQIMEILSPNFDSAADQEQGGQSKKTIGYGEGPGYLMVHYFPVDGTWKTDGTGTGTIIFGPCLCRSVTMDIKQPYSASYLPILGSYKFNLQASRILDRSAIYKIFGPAGEETRKARIAAAVAATIKV